MKMRHGIAVGITLIACVAIAVLGQEQSSSTGSAGTLSTQNRVPKPQAQAQPARPATKAPAQTAGAKRPLATASTLQSADLKEVPFAATASGDSSPMSPSALRSRSTRMPGVPAEPLRKELPPVLSETRDADANGLPVGPQNPSLNISWIGPIGVNVGEETTCEIAIRNLGQTVAYNVVVHTTIPGAMRFISADPEPTENGKSISWTLGQIVPGAERRIQVKVNPEDKGTVTAMASVTFSSMTYANIRIEEPKLTLQIEASPEVILGDPLTFALIVTNPGSSSTSGVTITAILPDGLKNANGNQIEYEVGNLEPDESRAVQISVTAVKPGEQRIRGVAAAGAKLKSPAEAVVNVIQPQLALKASGPALRYLDREATYTLTAMNPGSAMDSNVRLVATIPAGFQFAKAAEGGKHDWTSRTVSWFLGQLQPGESREVQLSLIASEIGQQTLHANATAERDLKATAETITQVDGIAALLLEVVDIDDPVEVGRETAYEIRVTNQGSKAATNVQIVAEVPEEMRFLDAKGPVAFKIDGQTVLFDPLPKLAPKADAIYRVKVRGTVEGDVRFRARLTSDALRSPVVEEESTKIYKD